MTETRKKTSGKPIHPDPGTTSWFWDRVSKSDDCWEWTGKLSHGYGVIQRGREGQKILAHRYSWTIHNGAIPDLLLVCHHCDNPSCVRPDHLFVGTHADNLADARNKGRLSSPAKGWRRYRTHCPQGHPFNRENTYIYRGNTRLCRPCRALNQRAYRERRACSR